METQLESVMGGDAKCSKRPAVTVTSGKYGSQNVSKICTRDGIPDQEVNWMKKTYLHSKHIHHHIKLITLILVIQAS